MNGGEQIGFLVLAHQHQVKMVGHEAVHGNDAAMH
jgi:hypothetical protein